LGKTLAKSPVADVSVPEAVTDLGGEAAPGTQRLLTSLVTYRDYRLLWGSIVMTQIGQWMLQITLGWVMLALTNSAGYVGLIGFASGIPFILVSIPAGVLIDRIDRRQILLVSQVVALVVGLGLALLVSLGHVEPWQLLLAAFLNGCALAINNATVQTMVPSYVRREHLQNAIAVMSAGQNSTRILGPSLGGPAIALLGSSGALYLQSAFLLAALLITLFLPSVKPVIRTLDIWRNIGDGIRFVAESPILLGLIVLAAAPSLLIFPYVQLLPVYARDILHIGATGLGLMLSAGGIGAVVGSLVVAGPINLRRPGLVMLLGTLIYVFVVIAFSYSTVALLTMGILFCCGFLGSAFMSLNNTLLHVHLTDDMRGRVMGIYTLTLGLSTIGAWPMGIFGDMIGVPNAIAAGSILTGLCTLWIGFHWRVLRTI
jgi:MFS family permease